MHSNQESSQQQQRRTALDPCFSGGGHQKIRSNNNNKGSRGSGVGGGGCHPTILSHRMFHRHPSLSVEHFHCPSLSDSNPFPWLDGGGGGGGSGGSRQRRDSVFVSDSWDSLIDRHLCNPRCRGASSITGPTAPRFGRALDELLDDDDDCGEEADDVFVATAAAAAADAADTASKDPVSGRHQHHHHHRPSRDPRWREAVAEAVRREFDPAACRRAHRDRLRVPVELPTVGRGAGDPARRRLLRLLGGDSGEGGDVGDPRVVLLCDRQYMERLASAMERRRQAEAAAREARLAEAERLRLLRLL